jgi:hypothetical protein
MQIDIEKVISTAPDFYHGYIRAANTLPIEDQLRDQLEDAASVFGVLMYNKAHFRYAAGKWTPSEMLGHLIDAERIFTYRALRFGRNDATELPGFEEDDYVLAANADARSIDSLLEEFRAVRQATMTLYQSFSEQEKWRAGKANGQLISVYALFYATIGHFNHHLSVLKERY